MERSFRTLQRWCRLDLCPRLISASHSNGCEPRNVRRGQLDPAPRGGRFVARTNHFQHVPTVLTGGRRVRPAPECFERPLEQKPRRDHFRVLRISCQDHPLIAAFLPRDAGQTVLDPNVWDGGSKQPGRQPCTTAKRRAERPRGRVSANLKILCLSLTQ